MVLLPLEEMRAEIERSSDVEITVRARSRGGKRKRIPRTTEKTVEEGKTLFLLQTRSICLPELIRWIGEEQVLQ